MFITVKDKQSWYVAISNREACISMNPEDMLLEDNLTMCKIRGHKGWYMVWARMNPAGDYLRYTKDLFAEEINHQSLLRYTLPKMKELLNDRELVKDKYWYNELLIVSKDKAFFVDGYFCLHEVSEFDCAHARSDIVRGCLDFCVGLPAKVRIREGVQALEELRGKSQFPLVVLDTATGKKEVWYSYEDAIKKTKGKGEKKNG